MVATRKQRVVLIGIAILGGSCTAEDAIVSPADELDPVVSTAVMRDLARDVESIPLESAKLIIEHNATDRDTGFQAFVDGEPWQSLEIRAPDGTTALRFSTARGQL